MIAPNIMPRLRPTPRKAPADAFAVFLSVLVFRRLHDCFPFYSVELPNSAPRYERNFFFPQRTVCRGIFRKTDAIPGNGCSRHTICCFEKFISVSPVRRHIPGGRSPARQRKVAARSAVIARTAVGTITSPQSAPAFQRRAFLRFRASIIAGRKICASNCEKCVSNRRF